jgi:putative nucleotidyltransferase with HDIG domain
MKKKIDVRDIQAGMFISVLDRPWVDTPFLFQGFELHSEQDMATLRQHCEYVYIDLEKGPDYIPKERGYDEGARRIETLAEKDELIRSQVQDLGEEEIEANTGTEGKSYPDVIPIEEELERARKIERMARALVRESFKEVRSGKDKIDLVLAKKVSEDLVDSVIRNPDALVCLSHLKDISEYTALHSIRTTTLALAFARHLVLSRDQMVVIALGTLLHDIGMMRVPEEIISKPTSLTPEEFNQLKNHVKWGAEIVQKSGGVPRGAMQIIEQHHERADGSGYPGLRKGTLISDPGSLAGMVDVYDAVTSDRGYDKGMSAEDALKSMYEWRHKDFKPKFVEEFIKCMGVFPIGSLVELSTGSVGVVITVNRARRLKPKVAMVLTAEKTRLSHDVITDLSDRHLDGVKELKIARVLPSGSFDINPMDHIAQF